MSVWFGDPWPSAARPSPVCENPAQRVPTPVGAACLHCGEEISSGDRGVLQYVVGVGVAGVQPLHIECMVRIALGGPAHLLRVCSCSDGPGCDPDMGMTPREAAQRVWQWVQDEGEVSP